MSEMNRDLTVLDSDVMGRVQQERDELDARINRLTTFIQLEGSRKTVGESQWILLLQQHGIMYAYLNVLDVRLQDMKQRGMASGTRPDTR